MQVPRAVSSSGATFTVPSGPVQFKLSPSSASYSPYCSWEKIPAYSQRPHLRPSVTQRSRAAMAGSQGTALGSAEVRQELRQTRSPSPAKCCTCLRSPSPGRTAAQRSRHSLHPFPPTSLLLRTLHGAGHTAPARASRSGTVGTSPALVLSLAGVWRGLQPGKPLQPAQGGRVGGEAGHV